jgi:hypothetical protein
MQFRPNFIEFALTFANLLKRAHLFYGAFAKGNRYPFVHLA